MMIDPGADPEDHGSGDAIVEGRKRHARRSHRPFVEVTAVATVILVSVGLFEGLARAVFAWREEVQRLPIISQMLQENMDLDAYEMPAPQGGFHWRLRPGFGVSTYQLLDDKWKKKRALGARILESGLATAQHDPTPALRINSDGFRGPELDPAHARPRILMLGDSTTFGIGGADYPQFTETGLAAKGIAAEVINGGVEGYAPRNLLLEIDRYKALRPEIVTLYIGWNALYARTPWADALENRLRLAWLVKRAYRALRSRLDANAYARNLIERAPKPDRHSSDVMSLVVYVPESVKVIERIIDELTSTGAVVALVTLPGLFTMSERPTPTALKIGHLPYFTVNPYVLAKLTDRYNATLRYVAEQRDLPLIDLAAWSNDALQPRDAYFVDSVHLNSRGLKMVGAFMAEQLIEWIKKSQPMMKRDGGR